MRWRAAAAVRCPRAVAPRAVAMAGSTRLGPRRDWKRAPRAEAMRRETAAPTVALCRSGDAPRTRAALMHGGHAARGGRVPSTTKVHEIRSMIADRHGGGVPEFTLYKEENHPRNLLADPSAQLGDLEFANANADRIIFYDFQPRVDGTHCRSLENIMRKYNVNIEDYAPALGYVELLKKIDDDFLINSKVSLSKSNEFLYEVNEFA